MTITIERDIVHISLPGGGHNIRKEAYDAILTAERERIADVYIKVASDRGWCDEGQRAWDHTFPGVVLRDADVYDYDGYDENNRHRNGEYRDPKPEDGNWYWCRSCRGREER